MSRTAPQPKQSNPIIRTFSPGWYAAVMGTAVIVIALFVFETYLPFAAILQRFFLALSAVMFVLISVPWFLRWRCCLQDARADLSHPVSAAFFPTMPISLIIWGLALEKAGLLFLPHAAINTILQVLWLLGAAGILGFAFTILSIYFNKTNLEWPAANLGWLIPPVSVLVLPVLGASLAVENAGTAWGELYFFASLMALGTGTILYLFVGSAVFARYLFHRLPPAHLAPTIWIGIAPPAILSIIAIKLVPAIQVAFALPDEITALLAVLGRLAAVSLWGFAAFWLVMAVIMTLLHNRWERLSFAMSWWAFTFPLGAFVVATGLLNTVFDLLFFRVFGLAALAGLLVIWLVVFASTLRRTLSGEIFQR